MAALLVAAVALVAQWRAYDSDRADCLRSEVAVAGSERPGWLTACTD